jgi:hypothetical protein
MPQHDILCILHRPWRNFVFTRLCTAHTIHGVVLTRRSEANNKVEATEKTGRLLNACAAR